MSARRIINTWDQLQAARAVGFPVKHCIAIGLASFGVRGDSRIVIAWSPFFKTDPSAHWQLHGAMAFRGVGARASARARRDDFEAAKSWVRDKYGYAGEWKRNRWRDLVPAQIAKDYPITLVNRAVRP